MQVFNSGGEPIFSFGETGHAEGQFSNPMDVVVDEQGRIYVVDQRNSRIQAFDDEGNFLAVLADRTILKHPAAVTLSLDQTQLYVADTGHHEIAVLDKETGQVLGRFGGFGASQGKFHEPHGLVWDAVHELLYVADTHNNRVQAFGFGAPPSIVAQGVQRPERLRLPRAPSAVALPGRRVQPGKAAVVPGGRGKPPAVGIPGLPPVTTVPGAPPVVGSPPIAFGSAPVEFALTDLNLFPNPFSPRAGEMLSISFNLTKDAKVTVLMYDKHLNLVRRLAEQGFLAGAGQMVWDGVADNGHFVQGGVYSVTVIATDGVEVASQTIQLLVANQGGQVPGAPGFDKGQKAGAGKDKTQGPGKGKGQGQQKTPGSGQGKSPKGRSRK